jgi:protein TonB
MKREKEHYPTLDDLAFQGRNKEYGAYFLRKKYPKHLFISGLIATSVCIILLIIPVIMELFEKPLPYDEMMPVIEFYSLNPPSDDDLSAMAKAVSAPPPPVEQVPVVVDSVIPEEKKAEDPQTEPEQEIKQTDTLAGSGSDGKNQGIGPGDDTGIYTTIDVYPRFPGGDAARFAFLRSQVHYPEGAIKTGTQGVVVVIFVIEKDGVVSNVEVNKGIGGGCDEEAVRVVKLMPAWDPGRRSGKAVRVLVKMPIVFRIPGKPGK